MGMSWRAFRRVWVSVVICSKVAARRPWREGIRHIPCTLVYILDYPATHVGPKELHGRVDMLPGLRVQRCEGVSGRSAPPPNGPGFASQSLHCRYTLGRIGTDNVVIGVPLPELQAIAKAIVVAHGMRSQFPNLRFAVSSGVGGAAAGTNMQLGDVFVSSPAHTTGGVFEFDHGKRIQGQGFIAPFKVIRPPLYWQSAIEQVAAILKQDETYLAERVANVLKQQPDLLNEHSRPDPKSALDCVPRNDRHREHPIVHCGLIASASSGLDMTRELRHELAEKGNVMCVDTTAFGTLRVLPCLVVRGFSTYEDPDENTAWQGYAALVAAAYAKEVLACVSRETLPSWHDLQRKELSREVEKIQLLHL
ncbi:hypothetical protein ACCO45_003653 [Purpureocillium lilacinum]|uniref:Uncharacterized protein n=1 Tax=Purpureocillium lilacinum TaxID=33203 RepID=A0ACC4E0G4_PURLI